MLPEPMLAKPGPLPSARGWSFEPKWDGFRAIVRSGEDYCVRSRRGWRMTELLPEFAAIPVEGVFDGELVAFGDDGLPSFERLSRRILHGDTSIPVALVFFDVLEVEGLSTMRQPYRERARASSCSSSASVATSVRASTMAKLFGNPSASAGSKASSRSG